MQQRQRISIIFLLLGRVLLLFLIGRDDSVTFQGQIEPKSNIAAHGSAETGTGIQDDSIALLQEGVVVQELAGQKTVVEETVSQETDPSSDTQDYLSLQSLLNLYTMEADSSLADLIVHQAIREYNFAVAHEYQSLLSEPLAPNTALYLILHSDELRISNVKTIQHFLSAVESMRIANQISSDDYVFYRMLAQLWQKNIDDAILLAKQIRSPKYTAITEKLVSLYTQSVRSNDMPSYYYTAQMSVTLLEYGYFSIAAKMALDISLVDSEYKLPYQVLAKSFYLTHQREDAAIYLDLLTQKDDTQAATYRLLQGIALYRAKDYQNALFHLKYSAGHKASSELSRYIVLSYIALGDYSMAAQTWQSMLGMEDIQINDFYDYFSYAFYVPIQNNKTFALYNHNQNLAALFVYRCNQLFPEHDVCDYGHAGLEFARDDRDTAAGILSKLAQTYDYSYIHSALGDYYEKIGQTSKAQEHYSKAISLALSQDEKDILRNKLLSY